MAGRGKPSSRDDDLEGGRARRDAEEAERAADAEKAAKAAKEGSGDADVDAGPASALGGNSLAAERLGAETDVMDRRGGERGAGRGHGGDPVDAEDGDGLGAGEPGDGSWGAASGFGDPGWVPQPSPAGPVPQPAAWFADAEVDGWRRESRLAELDPLADPLPTGVRPFPEPCDHVAAEAPGAWARAVATSLPHDEVGSLLRWWIGSGTHLLGPATGSRGARELRLVALAALALDPQPVGDADGLALELQAVRHGPDQLELALAADASRPSSTVALLADHVDATPGPPVPLPPDDPPDGLMASWVERLALRPGSTWRDGGPRDAEGPRWLHVSAAETARQRREHLAGLGIGLFRDALRTRIRVGGWGREVARLARPRIGGGLDADILALANAVDLRTSQVIAGLQQLGAGLMKPPYLDAEEARELLHSLVDDLDALVAGVPWYFAQWTRVLTASLPLPPPPPPAAPDALSEALRVGRPDRARRLLGAGSPLQALLPPLHSDTLEAARADLPVPLDAIADLLVGPVALAEGRLDRARAAAQRSHARALARGSSILLAEAAVRMADVLEQTDGPEAADACLAENAARLFASGAIAWAARLTDRMS
jgi:hypothetical protein